ncbi:MAG: hypothetical protein A4S14_20595 [Proteobacteria bacterium SG_bin9]|nr:MAG: hypothetical protein A4S14_20595 [Proteobacteria bacterium SG_bin9]
MSSKPIEVVQELFAAFGQGNVSGVLDRLSDDVDWGGDKSDTDVPTHVARRGRSDVAKFFEAVTAEQDFQKFELRRFFAEGSDVAVLAREEFTFRRSGRHVGLDVIHHFTVMDGRVTRYRSYYDTSYYAAAWRGS